MKISSTTVLYGLFSQVKKKVKNHTKYDQISEVYFTMR